ncbi:MAG: tetratricopeptide repeat protein, partial [Limisphaerales bacterium]
IESADALRPELGLDFVTDDSKKNGRLFHAIFFNYLLDCLPAAVLKVEESEMSQLHVQTCLARGVGLQEYTTLSASELARRAESSDWSEETDLLKLYPLFVLNYDYRPVEPNNIPYGTFVIHQVGTNGHCSLHNYGAIRCLEQALGLLQDGGFVLFNDYDDTSFDDSFQGYRHQRFGGSSAIGLNLPLMQSYFEGKEGCQWIGPLGRPRGLCTRMLGRCLAPETITRFQERFSKAFYDWLYAPIGAARNLASEGHCEAARSAFCDALARQSNNWALMSEIADFLTFTMADYPAGFEMAKAGLELNPVSPELWNTLGDCLFYLGREEEAHTAFLRARELSPTDVRTRYNLSFTFQLQNDEAAALQAIAEGLALDKTGGYRERLLQKQSDILNQIEHRQQERSRLLANRFGGQERMPDGS